MYAMTRSPVAALLCTGIYKLMPWGLPCPMPNLASYAMVIDVCPKVTLAGMTACVAPAMIPLSSGDETSFGGVVSARIKAECVALKPSVKVSFGGKGAVPMTSPTAHDGFNMAGGVILGPSQCKVTIG